MLGGDLSPAFWMMYRDPTKQLEDLEEFAKRPEIQKLTEEMRYCFQIVLAGMTPRDIEYQEKVLDEILAATGGWKVAAMAEPDMQKFTLLYLIRLPFKGLNFAYGGTFHGIFAQFGTPDYVVSYAPIAMDVLGKHQETGRLVQCGNDAMMGCVAGMGGGTYAVFEQFMFWDPHDKESVKEALAFCESATAAAHKHGFPTGLENLLRLPKMTRQERQSLFLRAKQPARYHWQWKIKQMLDPNDTGDECYDTLEKPPG